MKVHTHTSGSPCVVQLSDDWERYIIARRDVREAYSHVEYVRNGQVREQFTVSDEKAPETICQFMRKYK